MTGVILAGGRASRFGGENKAFLEVGGKKIIDTQMKLFKALFSEIIIVTNDTTAFLGYDALIASDIIKGKGPLGGIYTALHYMKNESCFVSACDMPFLNGKLIRYMIDNIGRDWIYTILYEEFPSKKRGDANLFDRVKLQACGVCQYEPLHTIYTKKCMKTIKRMILSGDLKISPLFDELRAKAMTAGEVKTLDPKLRSFKNINTREDLERCK